MSLSPLRVVDLRCEHRVDPLGLDEREPRLAWRLDDPRPGARQAAWQVVAASTPRLLETGPDLWDSGRVRGDRCLDVPWGGPPLAARQKVWWRARAWDLQRRPSAWSAPARFEAGLLEAGDWQARWIGRAAAGDDASCPLLRGRFALEGGAVASARLYVTARGLFEAHLNGRRVGDDVLAPGWTDYSVRIPVTTYDVTGLVRPGANAIAVTLADGWYAGTLGWEGRRRYYGARPSLLAQLEVEFEDGRRLVTATDGRWRCSTGGLLAADLYQGERFDARREPRGWTGPDFDDAAWEPVEEVEAPAARLAARRGPPVRRQQELAAVVMTEPVPGTFVFDLGQNMVGWARVQLRGAAGDTVTLRYAEMLQADGTPYTANLRTARATDVVVCRGGGEVYEPRFTFHGFRYVELAGLRYRPSASDVTGVVVHSDLPATGSFECAEPLVNRLQANIDWGLRGNFLDVPTDCPQRDERLGWTGDAQIFAATACANRDVAAFFAKWCLDLADAQHPDGGYPHVAPDALGGPAAAPVRGAGGLSPAAAWADAGVIVPWTVYRAYGDTRILERQYDSMARWIAWREREAPDGIPPMAGFGDWLAIDIAEGNPGRAPTPRDLVSAAYFARVAGLMASIARVLRRGTDARRYAALARRVRRAFIRTFVTPAGLVAGDTQTGYLLALGFDLLPRRARQRALQRLVADIERRGWKLSTGFVGTPLLAPVLTACGRADVAWRLLLQREYPSWLYTVLQGATTMWERWNSWTREKGFGDASMNSFNHYAYGAIGEWLYAGAAGIECAAPGYRRIRFRPRPGGDLAWARAEIRSPYGPVRCGWRVEDGELLVDAAVPPNASAILELPGRRPEALRPGIHSRRVPWQAAGA